MKGWVKNNSCIKNVSTYEVYAAKQKWTMNESLIFFKIRGVFQKY